MSQDTVTVHIKFRDVEQTFTGDVEQVWASINRFFSEFIPSFELARKITLTIDLQRLIEDVEGIIAAHDRLARNPRWRAFAESAHAHGLIRSIEAEYYRLKRGNGDSALAEVEIPPDLLDVVAPPREVAS